MSVIGNTQMRLDEEQAMLLDYARSFCAEHGGSERVRERLEQEHDFTPELWNALAAMGWTGIGLDEAVGGAGLGIGAAVPVLESMGRALLGTPLLSTLLCGQLLQRAAAGAASEILGQLAAGTIGTVALLEHGDWGAAPATRLQGDRLFGIKELVGDAASARWIAVSAQRDGESVVALVDAATLAGDAIRPRTLIDLTHRAADLHLDGTVTTAVFAGEAAGHALRDVMLLGALLVASESTGATAACLDTTVEYLKTRKQFGRLIGSYQALKHPAVDMLTGLENSRSFVYHGATLAGQGPLDRDAEIACRMAKAQAVAALGYAADRAVQFHGGMGFSWDCDAQLYLRRAQWAQQQFGDAQHHRRRLATLLFD